MRLLTSRSGVPASQRGRAGSGKPWEFKKRIFKGGEAVENLGNLKITFLKGGRQWKTLGIKKHIFKGGGGSGKPWEF